MPLVVKDRVKVTTTTTGTGTLTLGAAAAGFQSFSVIGDGNTTYYAIVDSATGAWEVGIGTYTAAGTTLARTTVLESSNANALVNFAAGSKDVFVTYPADALYDGAVFYNSVFNGTAVAFDTQTFNSSGTWTKPSSGTFAVVEIWGGGGGGQRSGAATSAYGGAGGGYVSFLFRLSELPATVTTTVGAGGAARATTGTGNPGNTSSFGAIFTATGGAGGTGANIPAGGTSTLPGSPYYVDSAFTFPASSSQSTSRLFSEAGGVGASVNANGGSVRSSGGGGGGYRYDVCNPVTRAPGTSTFGGNGSSVSSGVAAAGAQPGGGGGGSYGGTSGAGGAGRIKVTVY